VTPASGSKLGAPIAEAGMSGIGAKLSKARRFVVGKPGWKPALRSVNRGVLGP
jgi:hypothetical protein